MAIFNNRNDKKDIKIYSYMMINCFITMDAKLTRQIMNDVQSGKVDNIEIDEETYNKLFDTSTLENYSKEEIKKFRTKIDNAITRFKEFKKEKTDPGHPVVGKRKRKKIKQKSLKENIKDFFIIICFLLGVYCICTISKTLCLKKAKKKNKKI